MKISIEKELFPVYTELGDHISCVVDIPYGTLIGKPLLNIQRHYNRRLKLNIPKVWGKHINKLEYFLRSTRCTKKCI